MAVNQPQLTGRDKSGRFISEGNVGRPLGAVGRVARQRLEFVKSLSDIALQKLSEAVGKGERWAVELTLSKVLPATRTIEFEGMSVADIESATANGDISPDEMRAISMALARLRSVDEIEQIRGKLLELEAIVNDGQRR